MVNTFLVDFDFFRSAQLLDPVRLPNQRRETQIILNAINQLWWLAGYFNQPPTYQLSVWIRSIIQTYRKLPYRIAPEGENWRILPVETQDPGRIKLGYANHPIVRMWFYHPAALRDYQHATITEWIRRGGQNSMEIPAWKGVERPAWTYDPRVIQSHRAALLEKELKRGERPWYQLRSEFLSAGPFEGYLWTEP